MSGVLRSLRKAWWHAVTSWKLRKAEKKGYIIVWGRWEISGAENASIGDNIHIQKGTFIQADGGLSIGNNVHVGRNLTIYTMNHRFEGAESLPYDSGLIRKPVVIEDNVWIGSNVSIAPGVRVGEGAIIGLGAVVTKDVPPLAIVGGNPAEVIRYRDREEYERLKREKRFH
ncbi:MAG: acyltransferase [Thermoplasmata archaeon]|nr:acyltransferase [Thermoplasmata archaeon]